jgi:hypothetical protein
LGAWVCLEVNASNRTLPHAQGLVVLHELLSADRTGELIETEDLRKIASVIADLARHNFDRTFDVEGAKIHRISLDPPRVFPAAAD